ncbi:MAG: FHA domain-containing protein [Phycisphaerales bacterium]|nr:FHA domain-containing protein [Phycisphaerales bacterium]
MNVKLVMFKQDGQRRDFELKRETATFGRNVDCDFQIPLEVISRKHAQLAIKDGKLSVRDLGSSNGTFVNNKRVQETQLAAGDTLTIGPVIFTIVIDGQPEEIQPIRTIVAADTQVTVSDQTDSGTVDVEHAEGESAAEEKEEAVAEVEEVEESSEVETPLAALEALAKKKK